MKLILTFLPLTTTIALSFSADPAVNTLPEVQDVLKTSSSTIEKIASQVQDLNLHVQGIASEEEKKVQAEKKTFESKLQGEHKQSIALEKGNKDLGKENEKLEKENGEILDNAKKVLEVLLHV